ncbi:MAG: hypothetical protein D6683_10885 [Actinomyces sp.]|nr:MAG: hypothetical protein D6683_10885 [Actinomyces sp.]
MVRRLPAAALAVVVFALLPAAPGAAGDGEVLRPPVDVPIAEHFSLPFGPYGPGNRGVDYDAGPGLPVRAVGAGRVVFAGPVAGSLHVSIDHGGGLVSSYSFVGSLTVTEGRIVEAGDVVAVTGPRSLHLGLRLDGDYVDPERFLGRRVVSVHLVPVDDDPWGGAYEATLRRYEEIRRFVAITRRDGWGLDDALGVVWQAVRSGVVFVHDVAATLAARLDRIEELAEWSANAVDALAEVADIALAAALAALPEECTPRGTAVEAPRGRRIVIVVDGLDSSSSRSALAAVDFASLGYDEADTVRFSYGGGAVPSSIRPGSWSADLPASDYTAADTHDRVAASSAELAALLVEVARRNPGVPIDVVGHSLGGVVTQHGVIAARAADPDLPVDTVVTVASPHRGTTAADLAEGIDLTGAPGALAAYADLPVVRALGTPVVEDLSSTGWVADHADDPFPDDVNVTTIGVDTDLVVPSPRTVAAGADHHTVLAVGPAAVEVLAAPLGGRSGVREVADDLVGAHSDVTRRPELVREIGLAVAHRPPTCRDVVTRMNQAAVGEYLEATEVMAAKLVVDAQMAAVANPVGAAVVGGAIVGGAVSGAGGE